MQILAAALFLTRANRERERPQGMPKKGKRKTRSGRAIASRYRARASRKDGHSQESHLALVREDRERERETYVWGSCLSGIWWDARACAMSDTKVRDKSVSLLMPACFGSRVRAPELPFVASWIFFPDRVEVLVWGTGWQARECIGCRCRVSGLEILILNGGNFG